MTQRTAEAQFLHGQIRLHMSELFLKGDECEVGPEHVAQIRGQISDKAVKLVLLPEAGKV